MQWLLLQTFAWMTGVGLIGAMLGCMAHRFFAGRSADEALLSTTAVASEAVMAKRDAAALESAVSVKTANVPVVEASRAPAPVALRPTAVPTVAGVGTSPQPYTYPITTIGIPRANPELVQPQIQKITLPAAAPVPVPVAPVAAVVPAAPDVTVEPVAPAAPTPRAAPISVVAPEPISVAPATVTIRQTAAPLAPPAPSAPIATAEPAQPRPEPLRPELARSPTAPPPPVTTTLVAPVGKAPVAPGAPAPVAPAVVSPVSVLPAVVIPAPAAPTAPAPVVAAPPEPIAKPSLAATEASQAPEAYAPVAAGGAALAALAARAAAVAAATASTPATATVAAPIATPSVNSGDDLMRIRLIDAVLQDRLRTAGVTRFNEIARWSHADVGRIGELLGVSGRIEQENWIEQAQILATGGETEYSRRRSRGEVATNLTVVAPIAPVQPTQETPAVTSEVTATLVAASTAPVAPAAPAPGAASPVPSAPSAAPVISTTMAAGAAAGAAAAAMAAAAVTRATANVEPSMPAKLVDAIRENLVKPTAAPNSGDAVASQDSVRVLRPDLAGLRSVRSEALRDVTAPELLRNGSNARSGSTPEDLKRVRGIGVLIEKKLNSLGVVSYEHIANWTNADIDRVSQILDFKGRIERESWVEQARILASGGHTEFSKRVDRGEA